MNKSIVNENFINFINKFDVLNLIPKMIDFEPNSRYVTNKIRHRLYYLISNLEWSPVHRSEKFWRENAHKLNDANYELLKILINLLETSSDALILSVACFDLGEYVRHYQRGKQ